MIHELLGNNPLNGKTIPQLKKILRTNSKYQILEQIDRERKQGFPICHTRHTWKRYYLADSKKHFETFFKHYKADVNREVRGLEYCEKILHDWKVKR